MIAYENGIPREMTEEEIEEIEKNQTPEQPTTQEQQAVTLMRAMARTATNIPDAVALSISDILPIWKEFLDSGEKIGEGVCIMHEGQCYRQMQPGGVTPIESQPPGADGMLAVYRPIDKEHAGTLEDPIPWVNGMDCFKDKYYSHDGEVYLCKQDMTPCVWAPGTPDLWQWEVVPS